MHVAPSGPVYLVDPSVHARIREQAMNWAISTSRPGEPLEYVLGRAQTYVSFVLDPLQADQVARERAVHGAPLN